jgi:hypothetical protein
VLYRPGRSVFGNPTARSWWVSCSACFRSQTRHVPIPVPLTFLSPS